MLWRMVSPPGKANLRFLRSLVNTGEDLNTLSVIMGTMKSLVLPVTSFQVRMYLPHAIGLMSNFLPSRARDV
jgi:hypothetical protein